MCCACETSSQLVSRNCLQCEYKCVSASSHTRVRPLLGEKGQQLWGVPEDPWALSPVPPAPADGSSSLDWTRCSQEKSLKGLGILLALCHFRRTHLKEEPPFSLLSPLPLVPSSPPPPPSIFNHPTEIGGCFTCNEAQRQKACPLRPSLFLSDQATHTGNPGRAEDSPAP